MLTPGLGRGPTRRGLLARRKAEERRYDDENDRDDNDNRSQLQSGGPFDSYCGLTHDVNGLSAQGWYFSCCAGHRGGRELAMPSIRRLVPLVIVAAMSFEMTVGDFIAAQKWTEHQRRDRFGLPDDCVPTIAALRGGQGGRIYVVVTCNPRAPALKSELESSTGPRRHDVK